MVYFSSPQSNLTLAYLATVSLYIISICKCSKYICVPHAAARFLMLWEEEAHNRDL